MHHQSIKNIFIFWLTLLSFGFLSAQFVIPSGINNVYQLIQRVWITTSGTTTGSTVVDFNTGANKIYVNPNFLSTTGAYSGQYLLTLDNNWYLSFTSWSVWGWMSGAYISWGNLYLSFNNGSTTNIWWVTWATGSNGQNGVWIATIVDNNNGTFTVNLSNGSGYTINVPGGGWTQYWTQNGNDLYPSTLTNNIGIGTNSPSEQLTVDGSFVSTNNNFILSNTDTTFGGDLGVGMQWSTGDQQYWIGINDDNNGVFTNEMSYTNTTTNTYANYGINPNFGVVMNRRDDVGTFPGGKSAIAVDTNGTRVIGKSIWSDTNMIWYNDNFDTLMHLQNDGNLWIGISSPSQTLSVSGTFSLNYNDSYGYNALLGYDDPFFSGSLGFLYGWSTTSTMVGIFPWPSGTEKIGVMINNDSPNTASSVAVEPWAASITRSFDANGTVNQVTVDNDGIIVTASWNQSFWFTKDQKFGARTSTPDNTIDIAQTSVPGTLWLNLPSWPGNSGQILWINDDGDVIMLGNISWFGGGWASGPWEYGAGLPQSAQIMGANNTSSWSYSVVWGRGNIGSGDYSFIGGGRWNNTYWWSTVLAWGYYNVANGTFSVIGGWASNITHWLYSTIAWGNINTANGDYVSLWWGSNNNWVGTHSTIAWGYWNVAIWDYSIIAGWRNNRADNGSVNAFIGAGSGNITSGGSSFIGGGVGNTIAALYATIVGGTSNSLYIWALYSFIWGGGDNIVTDRYSSIIWWLNNSNQSEKSFIGWGENNTIDINSSLSAIVAGSWNTIESGWIYSFIGGGFDNIIQSPIDFAANIIVWWGSNVIINGIASTIVGGYANNVSGGGGMFIWWWSENHADGDGMVVVWGSNNRWGSINWSSAQSFIGGGRYNTVLDSSVASIVGGSGNRIEENSNGSFIAGGYYNSIYNSLESAILWWSYNTATGSDFSIVGGFSNVVSQTASVALGRNNQAIASDSFAFGNLAQASHPHTFVWNDGLGPFASMQPNTFLINASAWVGINTNSIEAGVAVEINNVLRLQPVNGSSPFACDVSKEWSIFFYKNGTSDSYLCQCGYYASSLEWRPVGVNSSAWYCGNP